MTIFNYQNTDAEHIARLYYDTIHIINAKDYTKEQLNAWAPYYNNYNAWLEKYTKLKPFVASINETIIGFLEFEADGHIDCFYVHHSWQGFGVGAALISAIEKEAKYKLLLRIYV
ncbi:MAG: GNAT family N-acetyltransferase [Rickettsiales bacterium]|nr:MAG: GNAT family N-acetyltransferase [Rickettsiales bacterium]